MKPAVVFDMDGVLVDTEPVYLDIMRGLFAEHGLVVPESRFDEYVGVSSEAMWREIKAEFKLGEAVADLVKKEQKEQERRLSALTVIPPVNGAKELIGAFQGADVKLALASSSLRMIISLILQRTGLDRCFSAVVSGEDVARSKPEPDIFLAAASQLNAIPARCVVIEDSSRGVQAAKAAGMKSIGYINPNSGQQDLSAADLVVDVLSASLAEQALALVSKEPGRAM